MVNWVVVVGVPLSYGFMFGYDQVKSIGNGGQDFEISVKWMVVERES